MSKETPHYPHVDLMSSESVAVTDLSEKTQKTIAKFDAETDEDKKEALSEKIYGDVEDYIADKKDAEKKATKKASFENAKKEAAEKKKASVASAPTAATPPATAPATPAKKEGYWNGMTWIGGE